MLFPGDYPLHLAETLRPKENSFGLALDLFAGCGGLALGFEAAGFSTIGFEADPNCCATYNANLDGFCNEVFLTPDTEFPGADIIIGGPPCQPFSVGGTQKGSKDARDGFPAFIAAVAKLRPKMWLFENVRGLLYKNKSYFEKVVAELESLGYVVEYRLLNAVNYLVPQNRERMIVVGHKGNFKFPSASNYKVSSGQALGALAQSAPVDAKYLTSSQDAYIAKYEAASKCINPRDLNLTKPARTLTCRNLAGATGDMQRIRLPDGRRRRVSPREGARLQSFPDWFEFSGGEISQYNQIGNAVAPMFAFALANACATYLSNIEEQDHSVATSVRMPRQPEFSF